MFAAVSRRLAKIVEGKVEEDKLRTQHANSGAATGVRMQPIPPEKVVKMPRDKVLQGSVREMKNQLTAHGAVAEVLQLLAAKFITRQAETASLAAPRNLVPAEYSTASNCFHHITATRTVRGATVGELEELFTVLTEYLVEHNDMEPRDASNSLPPRQKAGRKPKAASAAAAEATEATAPRTAPASSTGEAGTHKAPMAASAAVAEATAAPTAPSSTSGAAGTHKAPMAASAAVAEATAAPTAPSSTSGAAGTHKAPMAASAAVAEAREAPAAVEAQCWDEVFG